MKISISAVKLLLEKVPEKKEKECVLTLLKMVVENGANINALIEPLRKQIRSQSANFAHMLKKSSVSLLFCSSGKVALRAMCFITEMCFLFFNDCLET